MATLNTEGVDGKRASADHLQKSHMTLRGSSNNSWFEIILFIMIGALSIFIGIVAVTTMFGCKKIEKLLKKIIKSD